MKLRVKLLFDTSKLPERANPTDAGLDLFADSITFVEGGKQMALETIKQCLKSTNPILPNIDFIEYGTGIAVEIPEGYVGLLFARSSVTKKDLILKNSVGVIDSGYRGEIKLRFQSTNMNYLDNIYDYEDKVGQLVIVPISILEVEVVSELSDSERGDKGFGSSGS